MEKSAPYHLLDRLNGQKYVVLGNHDRIGHVHELLKYVKSVAGMMSYKGIILTHCPIHPMELKHRFNKNIHGHIHDSIVTKTIFNIPDKRYFCVSCERIDYTPKTLEELGIQR